MQYLWSKISLRPTEIKETISTLKRLKRYYSHPKKSILKRSPLTLRSHYNFWLNIQQLVVYKLFQPDYCAKTSYVNGC